MRVLFLARWFPYPADNGSKIRIWNLLKSLRTEHEVSLVSFATDTVTASSLAAVEALCDDVRVVPYRGFRPNSLQARLGFFSSKPRSVIDTFSQGMLNTVRGAADTCKPDIVIASQIDMVQYALQVHDAVRILEELELTVPYDAYTSESSPVARIRKGLTWWKLERYLMRTLPKFEVCTVVSERERELVKRVCPEKPEVHVVPNGVDLRAISQVRTTPIPGTLIYSGALSYDANYDAVHYFLAEIFPLILEKAPDTKFFVTGSTNGVAIEQLPQARNVVFTGYLDEVWSTVARSWVSVVPLRLGGGTRLKVLESMALGTPVVATPKGVEGLDLTPEVDVMIADNPSMFAEKTLALLNNSSRRSELSESGRNAVGRYDWTSIGRGLNDLLSTRAVAQLVHG